MAITLVDTAGDASANTYASLTTATAYFAARPFSTAWTSASVDDQSAALAFATTLLDNLRWKGAKGSTANSALTQALAWPRHWAPTLEADANEEFVAEYFIDLSVTYFSSLTIPTPIVRATCEIALEILRAGSTDPFTRDTTRNVQRETVDVITTEYLAPAQRVYGLGQFPTVVALIAPLLRGGSVEIERV